MFAHETCAMLAKCESKMWLIGCLNQQKHRGGGDSGRWEAACTSHAENRCALQPSSIWPPPQLAAWPALKSLSVLSPMWKTRPLNCAWPLYLYNESQKALTPPTPQQKQALSPCVWPSNAPSFWQQRPVCFRESPVVSGRCRCVTSPETGVK